MCKDKVKGMSSTESKPKKHCSLSVLTLFVSMRHFRLPSLSVVKDVASVWWSPFSRRH
jgi:hypothetical protein